jgi:hypothetical protein
MVRNTLILHSKELKCSTASAAIPPLKEIQAKFEPGKADDVKSKALLSSLPMITNKLETETEN